MAGFSIVVVSIMAVFAIAGIIDEIFLGNKHGLGSEFKNGLSFIAPITLGMTGIICFFPVIAWIMQKTLSVLFIKLKLDPSFAVTSVLANDMGGYQLAKALAKDSLVGQWSGLVYASMMGATIVFTIPVGLASIKKDDLESFSEGILYGIASIPFGTFAAGLMMGIPLITVAKNLIFPTVISVLIIICLKKRPSQTICVFSEFSRFVNALALTGLGLAIIKELILDNIANSADIPVFRLLCPISEGIVISGEIAIFLSGALPLIHCLKKWLKKPLKNISEKTGLSDTAVTGFLLTCANNLAMFALIPEMNKKEKTLNVAFAVGASFVIGDHLAFTAANAPQFIAPVMVAKTISGVIAVLIANLLL